MATREREFENTTQMSDHEALMWNIEKDPWLSPSGASLTILDQPVEMNMFRRQIRYGVSKMPRLYQRVVPAIGPLATPSWVPDYEFDFDYHVREIDLPAPGTMRQVLDLAAQLYCEPVDRTRPLWRFVAIGGLEGGKGAVYSMFHHAISDGIGQLRMAELYQQMSRDEEPRPEVDLDAIIGEAVAASRAATVGSESPVGFRATVVRSATQVTKRNLSMTRRAIGEAAIWPADPRRPVELARTMANTIRSTVANPSAGESDESGSSKPSGESGSPLWAHRSRHRHLEYVTVPLEDLKMAAKSAGASINDAFIAGITEAAVRYHAERSIAVPAFNTSFVVSTRKDNKIGGNSFTPVPVQVSGGQKQLSKRMREVHAAAEAAREQASAGGGLSGLAGVLNLLPTSVITRTARERAAKIDFATSNLRGAPFPLFCAGAHVEATICLGPLAGTAANLTALSYDGAFDIGVFVDPIAISEPEAFRSHLSAAFADLIAQAKPAARRGSGPVRNPKTGRKSTARKGVAKAPRQSTTAKKVSPKRKAAKKATAKRARPTKAAAKQATAKTARPKRTVPKKPVAKKTVTKKAVAKKPVAKKPVAKKVSVINPVAKKARVKKPVAKKAVARKATAREKSRTK